MSYLTNYLDRRILPVAEEEVKMRSLMINLVNALDNELELIIKNEVKINPTKKGLQLVNNINTGFCSFKRKIEWIYKKGFITEDQERIMEDIRILRNTLTHYHHSKERPKYEYKNIPLMCSLSIKNIFLDCNSLLNHLKKISGSKIKWNIIPPKYAEECWGISL